MEDHLKAFMGSYVGGFLTLILGVYIVYRMSKSTEKVDGSILQPVIRGWGSGIGFILLGLVIIALKLFGKQ